MVIDDAVTRSGAGSCVSATNTETDPDGGADFGVNASHAEKLRTIAAAPTVVIAKRCGDGLTGADVAT